MARVNIQWHGTEACLDFLCSCGMYSHIESDFAINLQCSNCGTIWHLVNYLELTAAADQGDEFAKLVLPDDWPDLVS